MNDNEGLPEWKRRLVGDKGSAVHTLSPYPLPQLVGELLLRSIGLEVVYVDIATAGSAPASFGTADQEGRGSQGTALAIVQWICESLIARAQDTGLRI